MGFEPTVFFNTPVFKTGTLNHSVIHPKALYKLMTKYNLAFISHLIELKNRLFYIILAGLLSFLVSYLYSLELFYLIAKPLINLNIDNFKYSLIYTDITEAFFTYLNLSLYLGSFTLILISIHHIIAFLIPGLFEKEVLFLNKLKRSTYVACCLTIISTYYFILPFIWYFFISNDTSTQVSSIEIHFEGKINEYVLLVVRFFLSIMFIFVAPILLFIGLRTNLISLKTIINQRHFSFIFIFILGAFLSPPDIISQIIIAIPLCLSYEFIIFIIILEKNKL